MKYSFSQLVTSNEVLRQINRNFTKKLSITILIIIKPLTSTQRELLKA